MQLSFLIGIVKNTKNTNRYMKYNKLIVVSGNTCVYMKVYETFIPLYKYR